MASFDIFDTVLVRAVPSASVIHREVHWRAVSRGLIDAGEEGFVAMRQAAEASVRKEHDHVVLELVYRELAELAGLPDAAVEPLHQLELDVEAEGLTVVSGAVRLLAEARSSTGRGALFLSDMHLPPQFLKQQLERFGCWSHGDQLWVSGVAGARKRDGGLFAFAADVEGIGLDQLIHRGDDPITDRLAARWVGAAAIPVVSGRLTEREQELASGGDFAAMCAGASRLSRLQLAYRPASDAENAVRIGATVVGPFVASYAHWLTERCHASGIERLHFLSRDGEVLQQVSQALGTVTGGPAAHYLYGGRLPWQLAAIDLPGGPSVEWLVNRALSFYGRVSLEGCGARLGVDVDDLVELLGGQRTAPDAYLNEQERSILRVELCGARRDLILAAADQHRATALEYLGQEGLLDPGWALADVGWAGSTVRALNALLRSQGRPASTVFFFGYTGGRESPRLANCEAFVWDSFIGRLPPAGGLGLVEAMCSGSHGPVIGYRRDEGGHIHPRIRSDVGVAADQWWLAEVRRGVDIFLSHLTASLSKTSRVPAAPTPASMGRFLSSVAERPSPVEASVLGACPREEDAQGDSVHPLARPYVWKDLSALAQRGSMISKNLTWPAGALARTPQPRRAVLRAAIRVAGILRGVRR